MVIRAHSPAAVAEQYIIESIWNGHYAPGSLLPAERELAEVIGVTRTTLREVLQRLARDGWLNIQHGKPTKVNDFWQTASLSILEPLARLDEAGAPKLIAQLLSARTHISAIFIRAAIRLHPEKTEQLLMQLPQSESKAQQFADFDYRLHHQLALLSDNAIYALIFNGFKNLYLRVGELYFSQSQSKDLALSYYRQLAQLAQGKDEQSVWHTVREYGKQSGALWQQIQQQYKHLLSSAIHN